MGRNAGWLTAATALATYKGQGPDLIYLPEIDFDMEKFIADSKKIYEKNKGKLIVAASEGIKDKNGKYISEYGSDLASEKDSFGHAQLGGTGAVLADILKKELKCKARAIEFSLLQRCAAHWASATDVEETFTAGQKAVQYAVEGTTDHMVAYERSLKDGKYVCNYVLVNLTKVANTEKKIPREWITAEGTGLTQDYINYALPLIEGESKPPIEDGLPRFAKLKKVLATK
jgi:6-phosphofructokinase 1